LRGDFEIVIVEDILDNACEDRVSEIDIEQVALKPFCLYVEKNSAFTWKELESDILFTLESAVGKPVVIKVR